MVHLHVHSMYSLRDSIIKPNDLISRLKDIGQDTVAITDHGSSLGGVSFYKALKENGIRYIHGCEMYICDDLAVKDKNSKYYHLLVLCKNETGRKNLNRLISISNRKENFYHKPRIDFALLSQYAEGLIVCSACLAGEIDRKIAAGELEQAEEIALKYQRLFGADYYLEIQSHVDTEQITVNKQVVALAKKLHIPFVVTSDAHYVYPEDKEYQNKYAFNGSYKEDGEAYVDCYIQSEQEVREKLSYLSSEDIQQAIDTTHQIAKRCNVEMPLSAPIMPKVETPENYQNNYEWLQAICTEGFRKKLNIDYTAQSLADKSKFLTRPIYDENNEYVKDEQYQITDEQIQEYIRRYEYEMDSLRRMGFIDYILLVYSYANVADRRGIARGSGGGSLVCYLSNITDIDPIEHGLYFERFIDVSALSLLDKGEITAKELKIPDIDLDFSGESCKRVLKFLYDTYGEDRVASIGKFGTNQTKGTIRDMCKVLDIPLNEADAIAKSFEGYQIEDIDAMLRGDVEVAPSAKEAIQYVERYPDLFRFVRKLNGLPKSFGLHACGKIISTSDLDDFLPSCYDDNGVRYLQGDMHDVEDVGLVKVDVLGLRTLDQEFDTLEMAHETREFINPKQSFQDKKVLDIFRNGDTVGIFQFSSPGMKKTLQKMDVRGIEDLSIANALFRPGAMAYIDNFCKRRKGQEKTVYLHPDLEPILKNTYGIIVFQEQLIDIGRMAGIHNPDLLRKATAKKKTELLNQVKPELEGKLKERGWTSEQFNQLWIDMLDFARYSFNKSHSSAYGILAYMTAKEKAYYPAEFYAGLCNSFLGDSSFVKDHADEIISDMNRHKIRMIPFDYRDDHRRCSTKGGQVVFGIPLIKNMNQNVADALYQMKDKQYAHFWQALDDLFAFSVTKTQVAELIKLGFFQVFGNSKALLRFCEFYGKFRKSGKPISSMRKASVANDPWLSQIVQQYACGTTKNGKESLSFTNIDTNSVLTDCERWCLSAITEDFSVKEKIQTQKELLGFLIGTGRMDDRAKLVVKSIYPLVRKKDGKQFGVSLVAQSIGSGIETRYTVKNSVFNAAPVKEGDVILCLDWSREKGYFHMNRYKQIA